ncbi:hypothetical protein [Ramlibacter sp. AN1133]|uniref:hypothetical protein n=1 Tax=Ramlibacter sp. AN1133 TaxID=3133429 RepID=UPI0030C5648F
MAPEQRTRQQELAAKRAALLDTVEDAEREWDEARDWLFDARGTRGEGNAQGEAARAESAYNAANDALTDWEASAEGEEWKRLEQMEQRERRAGGPAR